MFKIKDGLSLGANTVIDASGNITVPGKTTLSNTTASAASLNLGTGTSDPTTPTSGDFWNNGGTLKFRGAATKTLAYTDSNITGTAANISGSGIVAVSNGGTNTTTTPTAGAVSYGNGSAYAFTAVGTSGQVLTSAAAGVPTWTTSTDVNTFNAIVKRDGSGNFSAGTITATLSGTATNATNLAVSDDTSTAATYYPSFALATSGNAALRVSSTKLTFNPGTGLLTATGFSGSGASLTSLSAGNISTGVLAVARGGTAGSATPTAGAVAYGNGTAYAFSAVGTAGQVLTSAAGSAPTWTTQSSLSVGTATNATNSTNATNINITSEAASASDHYLHFGTATTGYDSVKISSSGIKFQPSTGKLTVGGELIVGGNLTVGGTTTVVNSTTISVDDPIFTLGGDTAPTVDDNKDRGIEFRWHNGTAAKVGFFGYDDSTGKFTFVPDAVNTSEVFSGTKGTLDANLDWADVLNKPDPVVTVTLTGDVTGTANTTLTDLASGTVSVTTTIAANSVALGTDTTGNYVASIASATPGVQTGTSGLTISATAGEGTAATIAHADTSTLSGAQGTAGVSSVTVDGFGHVTGVTTATYLTAESDTLALVTGRGATTATASTFSGGLTVGGTGIVYNGSTSGTTTFKASAAAGTTTVTLPATTGTVITTGDSGTVTSTMIADGTIVNADINASAAIAITKLAASTISGVSLGNNLASLTIGGGLSGTSYNGSGAVTIAIDSTVALKGDTHFIGTTSVALNRASANLALTGISSVNLPGSTSGTVLLQPAAVAGTTTITLPATTGTVVTTGDSGTVTSTMIADGTIVNADINASAAIAITKLAASTISGVSLGNNLNLLTIGTGLSGTSYNGSGAVTIAIDSTVALKADTTYVGTTAVTLNRASANLALTGISSVTLPGSTSGTIQVKPAAVAGTGTILTLPATTGTVITTGDSGTVTSTMIADGTIVNADINASAAIAITKLAASTISGVSLGNNLASLTIGTGLSGASYNGSGAVTIAIDSTVALKANTTYVGTTAVTLNRASANLALTGISSVTLPGSTSGTVQLIPTAAAGTSTVLTLPATTGTLALSTGTLAQFAATTSAQLAGVISDETGSGALVFASSPSLTTPNIGAATGTSLSTTGNISGSQLISTVANGTAPLSVTSTTKVTNLNADLLDGYNTDTTGTASTVAARDGNGDVHARLFRSTYNDAATISGGIAYRINDTDNNFIRVCNDAGAIRTFIGAYAASNPSGYVTSSGSVNYATSAGTASTSSEVTITYNNDSNASYQMLWGSGNGVYGTAGITCNPSTDSITAAGNITAYSDARLKKNIEVIPDALNKVSSLSGYTFDRIDMDTPRQTGVIAQEVLAVLPEAVILSDEGKYSVAYGNMVGLLIEAIKELNTKVNSLQAQLDKK